MQTLWNRVALTSRVCGCPQCVQSVQAVSRRATTAARRPRYPTSSTLWYSGVFAAAATYDASVKQKRREQWDEAIAGVKEELGQSADLPNTTVDKQSTSQRSPLVATVARVENLFQDIEPVTQSPLWPVNTGSSLVVRHVPPESIYATDNFKKRAEGARWVAKKLERAQLSMDILQLVLLQEAEKLNGCSNAFSALPLTYRQLLPTSSRTTDEAIQTKLAHLDYLRQLASLTGYSRHENDVALCRYDQDEHGNYLDQAQQLNHALQALFHAHRNEHIDTSSLLAKVAFNLHSSQAPPNLATYNTLLLGFEDTGQRAVVGAVVASLRDVVARPNEVTHACILRHYAATNNAYNFSNWIARMRGRNGGVTLARPDIHITEAGQNRLVQQEEKPTKIMQLPYPTPRVFAAIIEGTLKFAGFDTALRICESMGGEGWGLCMSGMTPLLQECADNRDWTSGLAVWRGIQALKARDKIRTRHRNSNPARIELHTFAAMLRLCSQCTEKAKFDEIWQVATTVHRQSEKELMQLLKAQQQIYKQKIEERSDVQVVQDPYLRMSNRPKMAPAAGEIDFVKPQLSELHAWRLEVRDQVVQDLQDRESEAQQHFYGLSANDLTSTVHIKSVDESHAESSPQIVISNPEPGAPYASEGRNIDMIDDEPLALRNAQVVFDEYDPQFSGNTLRAELSI